MDNRAFEDYDWRTHYDNNYAGTGKGFAQMEPAYRYGYDLAQDKRYQSADWANIEDDVRVDWEERYPDLAWDDAGDIVYYAWTYVATGEEPDYAGTGKGFAAVDEEEG